MEMGRFLKAGDSMGDSQLWGVRAKYILIAGRGSTSKTYRYKGTW